MNTRYRPTLLALIATAVAAATAPAQAATNLEASAPGTPRVAHVRYADLDLSTSAGERVLKQRIAVAVDAVCDLPHAEQLGQRGRVAACRADAYRQVETALARLPHRADAVARRD